MPAANRRQPPATAQVPLSEAEIIGRFFSNIGAAGRAAPGDDCALLRPPAGKQLVLSTDTSVAGRHFPHGTGAEDIGWRCLAVALSDLAACGAEADFCLLALSLPAALATEHSGWLEDFSRGFRRCAQRYRVRLIGGDIVRGELAANVQVGGWVDEAAFLSRSGASPTDAICVTGELGAAAAGLQLLNGCIPPHNSPLAEQCRLAFLHPEPQLAAGLQLAGLASACIDISDGLALDLSRLCEACGTGADLQAANIPACSLGEDEPQAALTRALQAGDDYQLCFCLPAARLGELPARLGDTSWRRIGTMSADTGLRLDGEPLPVAGWEHF